MAVKIENVKLGVCDVSWDGVDLGATKGGVEVTFETNTYQVKLDQTGETPVKDIITGRGIKVKVPLAETDLAKIAQIMPGVEAVLSGTDVVGVRVDIGINIDMFAVAKTLKLHPTGKLSNDVAEDFGLFKCAPTASFSFTYQTNQERVIELEFTAYPDDVYGGALGWFGQKPDKAYVYWGRGTTSQLNEAGIEALVGSENRGTRKGDVDIALEGGSNTTIWLAWPKAFNTGFSAAASFVDKVTGLAIPLTAATDTSVTGADGVTRTYSTYKSTSAIATAVKARIE